MQAVVRQAAISIADRYLSGRRYRPADVAPDVDVPKRLLLRLIRADHGSYDDFVRRVIPGNTKTVPCGTCGDVLQAHRKDTKSRDCVPCRRTRATELISDRIKDGKSVRSGVISKHSKLSWIATQSKILWGKPYIEVLREVFKVAPRPVAKPRPKPPTKKKKGGRGPSPPDEFRSLEERNKLVTSNQGLVWQFVHKYAARRTLRGLTLDDLVQEGMLGLIRAAEKFDPSKGFRFSTYATWWIRQRLDRAWQRQNFPVKLPCRYDFTETPGEPDTVKRRREKVYLAIGACSLSVFSDDMLGYMGLAYEDAGYTMVDGSVYEDFLVNELLRIAAYARIPADHLCMFCQRTFGNATLVELAEKYNVSREQVRQLVSKVKGKLKAAYTRERGLA